ncbi:RING finger protein 223-like [Hemitrygon akajei]|uniref:RING finger protein 223-like n=1 Tax=Hemitrygon akajei TaxID=2704970 RepID=UPI003BFA1742
MDGEREPEGRRAVTECPICYLLYDNGLKTPLRLPCAHTFCTECLARVCVFRKENETFPCPLCRAAVPIPPGGVPQLSTDLEVMRALPPALRSAQPVWLEGSRLCWLKEGERGTGTLVTLQLLPQPTADLAFPSQPVGVQHEAFFSRYGISIKDCCCLILALVAGFFVIFGIIFFLIHLIKGGL